MKKIVSPVLLLVLALGLGGSVFAQKVRLRSKLTPTCGTTSSLKFADIYADGNLAVVGSYNCRGVFIFDVSNPDSPFLSSWYNPVGNSGGNLQFLEAIVIGDRGYFGAGGGTDGVHIVDLTNPSVPFLLGKVNATTGGGHNTIHEMMVFDHEGARYLLENSNSTGTTNLRIINVTDPGAPVLKWTFTPGGWVHAMHIRGNRMYLSGFFSSNQVYIYDIANLATQTPTLLGAVQVGAGSNHSAWTDESGNYLYSARETQNGNLQVYNVSNPASPLLVRNIRAIDLNINAITPHNPVVMGNKLYVAWYQGGLQTFDITDPANPIRVGQYDTYPNEFSQSESEKEIIANAEPWDIMCGSDSFGNALPTSYGGNWAVYPFLGEDKVLLGDLTYGLFVVDVSHATENSKNVVADFDGDRKTDVSTFRPSTGTWTVQRSSDGQVTSVNWGDLPGDIAVNGDYDGDGKSDNAIFRPSTGQWWFIYSSNGSRPAVTFGVSGDVPVPADYDADGKTDIAVWRPSTGVWYINQSTLGLRYQTWGSAGDKPMVGDYEGDGKIDVAVWRPSNGVWYILQSSSSIPIYASFGLGGDKPLVADFTGDGRSDYSIYRPSTGVWYWMNSATLAVTAYQFGVSDDAAIPADFDGDGRADVSVYRPSTGVWYRVNSADSTVTIAPFGGAGDRPSPGLIQPQ